MVVYFMPDVEEEMKYAIKNHQHKLTKEADLLRATSHFKEENKKKKSSRLTLVVAEEIKTYVFANKLVPGDRLPNENELIEKFQMSKSTIREATRILEAQGLIKTRTGPGGGCFVHEVSENRTIALLTNYFYFKNMSIREIYQLRKVLEPEVSSELSGELNLKQIQELKTILNKYSDPPKSEEEEKNYHYNALQFHAKLAEFSKNELLKFIIKFMAKLLSEVTIDRRLFEPSNHELWQKGRNYQIKLIKSLQKGEKEKTYKIMYNHMCFAEKLMAKQETLVGKKFVSFE